MNIAEASPTFETWFRAQHPEIALAGALAVIELAKDGATVPDLKVKVSSQAVSKVRTPKEQAEQIVKGVSWTCSSAHMTDNARHCALFKDGKMATRDSKGRVSSMKENHPMETKDGKTIMMRGNELWRKTQSEKEREDLYRGGG